jgi:hypothetical protein
MKIVVFWNVTACGLVRTDDSVEHIASIITMERISELGKTAAETSK